MRLVGHGVPGKIRTNVQRLPPDVIEQAEYIPPSVASDAMERLGSMVSAIGPISEPVSMAGSAITVDCMVGDNIMAHKAISLAEPGDVIVINAKSHDDTAVWGDLMSHAAEMKGLTGVVVDGAIRDVGESRERDLPVFFRESVPAGPHKGWGGRINSSIQCGGVSVEPGDLVLGDEDGVVVVPRSEAESVIEQSQTRLAKEKEWRDAIEAGKSTIEAIGLESQFESLNVDVEPTPDG